MNELKNNIKKKVCNAKKGTIWLLKDLPKTLYEDNVDIFKIICFSYFFK